MVHSDGDGRFQFPGIPEKHFIGFDVYASKWQAKNFSGIKTDEGPITIKLEDVPTEFPGGNNKVQFRIRDGKGDFLPEVLIFPETVWKNKMAHLPPWFPAMSRTDELGVATFLAKDDFDSVDVVLKATDLAPKRISGLPSGKAIHEVVMEQGVNIRGRLVFKNKPLAGRRLKLQSMSKRSQGIRRPYVFESESNSEGYFTFDHVPSWTEYFLLGNQESFGEYAIVSVKNIKAEGSGSSLFLQDVEVKPALHIKGKVVTSNGQPIPSGAIIDASVDFAWGSTRNLGPDGHFEFGGMVEGEVIVNLRVPGYEVSSKNESRDPLNMDTLLGRLEYNVDWLVILLEPKDEAEPLTQDVNKHMKTRELPLRGYAQQQQK